MRRIYDIKLWVMLAMMWWLALPVCGQYSKNYDLVTNGEMTAVLEAQYAVEQQIGEVANQILSSYGITEVAAAGVYASKFLDRKSLKDFGLWSNEENYYYKRIYTLVADKILPKIWTVASMAIKDPATAIHWGPYLFKVCSQVKSLCQQFEAIVTNSTLSFSDLVFYEFEDELAPLMQLTQLGDIDWEGLIDELVSISHSFSKDNLSADISTLWNAASSLITSGVDKLGDTLLQKNSWYSLINGRLSAVVDLYNSYKDIADSASSGLGDYLTSFLGGVDNVGSIFRASEYNMTSWITDYSEEADGNYYTQRWYITLKDYESETLIDYTPPIDDYAIMYEDSWYRVSTGKNNNYTHTTLDETTARTNSEDQAGCGVYTYDGCEDLNSSQSDYVYNYSYTLYEREFQYSGSSMYNYAYACAITVTKSSNADEVVYEATYNSYTDDWDSFYRNLTALLSDYNDNAEDGKVYELASDEKVWFETTDASKLEGKTAATIYVTCSDGTSIADGNRSYKCRSCTSGLSEHNKTCSMLSSIEEDELDTSEIDTQIAAYESQISEYELEIAELQSENSALYIEIYSGNYTDSELEDLRSQVTSNDSRISELESLIEACEDYISQLEEAKEELEEGEEEETDDYHRIPYIMDQLSDTYGISYTGSGWWSGYTYYRNATSSTINLGDLLFVATLTQTRKPKKVLGILIHRAITKITWELQASWEEKSVYANLILDQSNGDDENAEIINEKIAEAASAYPSCTVTVEYTSNDGLEEEDDDDDTIHLLWSSDRLEIAQDVFSRLNNIYSGLVSYERLLHYKYNILEDMLNCVYDKIDWEEGKKKTVAEEALVRWQESATYHNSSDE